MVGTRRALKFHDAGAEVYVVALAFSDKLVEVAKSSPRLHLVQAAADTSIINELVRRSHIVVIALDDEKARSEIWRVARRYRVLVNDATDADATDVVVPYEADVNGIRVAVTTEGKSGITARHALAKIVELLGKDIELKTMLDALWWAKRYMKKVIPDAKKRFRVYFEIERDPEFLKAVQKGDVEAAIRAAKRVVDEAVQRLR